MSERILGVLGGMGPLASAQFMARLTLLTPAARDQDHVPAILWSDPRVPDRTAARLGGGEDPLPWLRRGLRGLKAAGCGAVAIPCNTAHLWIDGMAEEGLPILHIVDAAAAALRAVVPSGPVGVLGTAATLQTRLYQDRLDRMGWTCVTPTPEEMDGLVSPGIAEVKANRPEVAFAPLAAAVRALAGRGAQAVVLGCTEIPLGIQAGPADSLGVPVVDTIDALARVAIAWAKGD
ncbi:Aspartate/glutamate racemase family protein [Rhodovastum atsumiense]|uniref:Aspartate/glutamate racemase family protein n=1 Tax=Rhodovastum atsumiense TaxID=504468 RepID=A0A5M6IS65_9PROT|nr:amino acid racemase [Rhodovastum atsumiense]KAA5611140.1 aspartate/glutamate racemase family protein [Rhodovastum atsumiense]CAH2599213.1 Aspartate/glutamate racemase family protein [Rhodovastum atsumiense]